MVIGLKYKYFKHFPFNKYCVWIITRAMKAYNMKGGRSQISYLNSIVIVLLSSFSNNMHNMKSRVRFLKRHFHLCACNKRFLDRGVNSYCSGCICSTGIIVHRRSYHSFLIQFLEEITTTTTTKIDL